jgi:hypothetical protein
MPNTTDGLFGGLLPFDVVEFPQSTKMSQSSSRAWEVLERAPFVAMNHSTFP